MARKTFNQAFERYVASTVPCKGSWARAGGCSVESPARMTAMETLCERPKWVAYRLIGDRP
jgi:hypothetical protein